MSPDLYADILNVAADAAPRVELPTTHEATHELLDAVYGTEVQLDKLASRLVRMCVDDPNRWGICSTCGLPLQRPSEIAGPHNPGETWCAFFATPIVSAYKAYWHGRRLASRARLRIRYKAGLVTPVDADIEQGSE